MSIIDFSSIENRNSGKKKQNKLSILLVKNLPASYFKLSLLLLLSLT
jgi:hypothetical protein